MFLDIHDELLKGLWWQSYNHYKLINMYDCLSSNSVGKKKKKKKVLNIYSNRGEICILSKVGMFLCASFAVVNYSNFMSGP